MIKPLALLDKNTLLGLLIMAIDRLGGEFEIETRDIEEVEEKGRVAGGILIFSDDIDAKSARVSRWSDDAWKMEQQFRRDFGKDSQ